MPKHLNDVRPGDLFAGRYLIESILADGGFGRVFRARHQVTGQLRAVKALMPAAVAHPHVRKRFNAEARVAARIGSPHVVEVSDTGIDGETGAPYLAMEFLDGETLDAKVERDGPLSRSETAAVFAELADAMGAAHDRKVLHLDLKPENLFLARLHVRNVTRPVLKVLDFGITKVIADSRSYTGQTATMGSPFWMPPEQTEIGRELRPSADVWSLGLLAFWALTGRIYWRTGQRDDAALTEILIDILRSPLDPPSVRAASYGVAPSRLPARFDTWFAACVHRTASQRFQHARAAVTALLLVLDEGRVQETQWASPPERSPFEDPENVATVPDVSAALGGRGTVVLPHDAAVAEALAQMDARSPATAREQLRARLRVESESAELWALCGQCSLQMGAWADAAREYSEAIGRELLPVHMRGRAAAWRGLGQYAHAAADETLADALDDVADSASDR